ncbi:hypothetical protein GBA65_12915 [Rubrobacter marinus]|uniref:Uncharacterized protein n=1 Tax=Rubrobacter marinus TaxID=2653852 RepID=A0A6G8PYK4_9ACTN|nr:hypothetical protein [Rubrobacter marinus]QIN79270.1 hypothetical protein GBA65_12915 [Rubrobacter marinus]
MRRVLLGRDEPFRSMHGNVEQCAMVESVELDVSGEEHEVVILVRDLMRPGCLFGWRTPAEEPDVGFEYELHMAGTVKGAAESRATVVWVNLEEDLMAVGYGLPKSCSTEGINWF